MKNKTENKVLVWDQTWLSRTSMSNDRSLRPFGHDNSRNAMVLIIVLRTFVRCSKNIKTTN